MANITTTCRDLEQTFHKFELALELVGSLCARQFGLDEYTFESSRAI